MPYDFEAMELPIEPIKFEGPAVDIWEARKEDNDSPEASVVDFLANYERIKGDLIKTMRGLVESYSA